MNIQKYRITSATLFKKCALLCLLCMVTSHVSAQFRPSQIFGNGLIFGSKDDDSNFYVKFHARIQSRFDGKYTDFDDGEFDKKYFVRRSRIKFDGFALSPKLSYKMEYDLKNSKTLDAVLKWNFYQNFSLWVGQTKLPGNRERVISSQNLQFVDRSLLNSRFNIDRDKGFQLRHHFNMGDMVFREMFSVSRGEGRIFSGPNLGNDYTGRVEFLPFGNFSGKGDYFASDLKREPEPKLAIGMTYDYNDNAVKSGGQLGSVLSESRDLETYFLDMMYKHQGLSIMSEYAYKKTNDSSPAIFNTDGELIESFYTGSAINAQVGYLFNNNWEIAGRITHVNPELASGNNDLREYTIGVSKYIVGHYLKVQSDISLLKEDNKVDRYTFRLQLELGF